MREGLQIGRIYGIPIYLHTSWLLIFGLITYSFFVEFGALKLAMSVPQQWAIAIITSLLFFGCLIFHEMSHCVVARHYKIPVISITLFIFGGVSRLGRDPSRAIEEFNIAVAGPVSNFVLAGGFGLVWHYSAANPMLHALSSWLAWFNFSLAVLNLLPGFPLDGGRIFRAIVWGITKDYSRSTRIASRSGQLVAYGMMGIGAYYVVQKYLAKGDIVQGMWLIFIGWFLLNAARQNQAQAEARGSLEGLHVADIMTPDLPTVGREISLEDYARQVLTTNQRAHLVVAHEQLVGLMSAELLHSVPREDWEVTSVQAVMTPKEKLHWAAPEESALSLLDRMRSGGMPQMPVISSGNVVGVVTRDSILHVLQARSGATQNAAR